MTFPNAALPTVLHFGVFELDLAAGELRKAGSHLRVQKQPFEILRILVQRPGEIITREELRAEIWSADTFVDFDNSLNTSINKLRDVLGDTSSSPRFIETVPRRGYRFIAPVTGRELAAPLPQSPPSSISSPPIPLPAIPPPVRRASWKIVTPAVALLLGLITGLFWYLHQRPFPLEKGTIVVGGFANRTGDSVFDGTLKQRLSVHSLAVLPLRNFSIDSDQEYFSDGMTDELITVLSKMTGMRVISHTSVERYKNTKRPLPEIARELGVDAIVEGAVMRSGSMSESQLSSLTHNTISTSGRKVMKAIFEMSSGFRMRWRGKSRMRSESN